MNAQQRWQEMIAQNLSASAVPGFRKQEISFADVAAASGAGVNGAANGTFYIPSVVSSTSFQQGQLQPTGDSKDLAIEGRGFFEVQLPNGSTAYTRDGEFQVNGQGQLATKEGYPVLGDAGPIQFNPNNGSQFTVSASGQITQGGNVVGHLQVVDFSNPGQLTATDNGYLIANQPGLTPAPASNNTSVRQGFLEASNSSPTTEMGSLISAMRSFEANQKVLEMQNERMGEAITDLSGTSST